MDFDQQYCEKGMVSTQPLRNVENSYFIDSKTNEYHDFYAKLLVESLGNEIPKKIREKWTKRLRNKGMFYSTYKSPSSEPGDLVHDYDIIDDPLIFNDKILEKSIEEKINFIMRKINDQEKTDNQDRTIEQDKI